MRRKCASGDARRYWWRSALLQVCCGWCLAFLFHTRTSRFGHPPKYLVGGYRHKQSTAKYKHSRTELHLDLKITTRSSSSG